MKFTELPTTRKGAVGEAIVIAHLLSKGCMPYRPAINGPHSIDLAVLDPSGGQMYLIDVKTYARRFKADQTGIDAADYRTYRDLTSQFPQATVYVLFVDAYERCIYGARLLELEPFATLEGTKVYFPLSRMRPHRELTKAEVERIGVNNPQGYRYVAPYFNRRRLGQRTPSDR